ncbi:unnamed protein product [Auanema sp. JU1783]|nr:unnamed protein product [Auanema sp. JU1783]
MRVFQSILLVCSTALAYDAVFFSNEREISKDFPSVENVLSTASKDSPVVFVTNPDFTLGQFSKQSSAYSVKKTENGLTNAVKSSKYHASRYIEQPILVSEANVITSESDFKPDSSVYVISGEEYTSMESTFVQLQSKISPKATFVITSSEAVSTEKERVKRVATGEMESQQSDGANGDGFPMPMNIPPYNRTDVTPAVSVDITKLGNCMLYLEGVNVIVQSITNNGKGSIFVAIPVRSNDSEWLYTDGDVHCSNSTVGDYIFHVKIRTKTDVVGKNFNGDTATVPSGTIIGFTLKITGDRGGYWGLKSIVVDGFAVKGSTALGFSTAQTVDGTNSTGVRNMGVNSIQYWAYGCGSSQAAFFKTDQTNVFIGISLYNTQIQPYGVVSLKNKSVYFTLNVDDCTGTFSTGSWMGIISVLVLLAGLIFGYLMLQSVETMDRFDDPKQKQITINVRE